MTTPDPRPLDQPPSPWGSVVPERPLTPPSPVSPAPVPEAPVQDQPTGYGQEPVGYGQQAGYGQPNYGTPVQQPQPYAPQPYTAQPYGAQPYGAQPTPYATSGYQQTPAPYAPDPDAQRRRNSLRNRRILLSLIPLAIFVVFYFFISGRTGGHFPWFLPVFMVFAVVSQLLNPRHRR